MSIKYNLEKKSSSPWIEKYRPTSINDLLLDKSTINKVNNIIKDKSLPNIIITGVPGIGKTTTILCLAKSLLGPHVSNFVLELNASDERGIKAVHDSIVHFCRKKMKINESKYAQHKIVLLDEADNMTKKAQQLINNLMEKYRKTTRFAFTCNNSSDIIESIQSRCIILRYKRLENEKIKNRLKYICENEKIKFNTKGINALILTSEGDMRKAINNLQLTFNSFDKVNESNVFEICNKPNPIIITNIFKYCIKNNIKKALECLDNLWNLGYSNSDISLGMLNTLKLLDDNSLIIDKEIKIIFFDIVCKTNLIISKGIDSKLQLTSCISLLSSVMEDNSINLKETNYFI